MQARYLNTQNLLVESIRLLLDSAKKIKISIKTFVANHPFSTPLKKHQKTVSFSDVFRGQRKGALQKNGLKVFFKQTVDLFKFTKKSIMENIFRAMEFFKSMYQSN